jgi:hypothetical protein
LAAEPDAVAGAVVAVEPVELEGSPPSPANDRRMGSMPDARAARTPRLQLRPLWPAAPRWAELTSGHPARRRVSESVSYGTSLASDAWVSGTRWWSAEMSYGSGRRPELGFCLGELHERPFGVVRVPSGERVIGAVADRGVGQPKLAIDGRAHHAAMRMQ